MPRIQRGSVCWYDPHPTQGHEQQKRRLWMVISPPALLSKHGLVTVCPITSQATASRDPTLSPWVVAFTTDDVDGVAIDPGWVLVHQVRTLSVLRIPPNDWVDARLSINIRESVATALAALAGWEPSP